MTESCGGATCTPPYPFGPSWLVHSVATERQFHSHRFAMTSPPPDGADVLAAGWAPDRAADGVASAGLVVVAGRATASRAATASLRPRRADGRQMLHDGAPET